MIRVTVLYPNEPGKKFDWDYYTGKHAPLVNEKLGPLGMVRYEIDRGISAPDPNAPPPFVAVFNMFFNTVDEVPDSSWFTNRIYAGRVSPDEWTRKNSPGSPKLETSCHAARSTARTTGGECWSVWPDGTRLERSVREETQQVFLGRRTHSSSGD